MRISTIWLFLVLFGSLYCASAASRAHAGAGPRPQTADQAATDPGARLFDQTELTPEQQRNLAEAECVVDTAVERLYATFDLDLVWGDYFDPMAALADIHLAYLAPEFEAKIPPELLRRKRIAELNYSVAYLAFVASHLRMEDFEQFDTPEFLRSLSPDVRKALKYGNPEEPPTLRNQAELETFFSSLRTASAVLRREIPPAWSEQSPAWVTLKNMRELPSRDEHFRPKVSLDDKGGETYLIVRDWWAVELRPRNGHMKITLFGGISE